MTQATNETTSLPPRHAKGAIRIIEAAEELIGRRGLDGLSMRQIAVAAGQANPAAVQYHFGSLEGVIDAIYDYRLPVIERRRAELMERASEADIADLAFLFRILMLPLLELRNGEGRRGFARFSQEIAFRRAIYPAWTKAAQKAPATRQILALIDAAIPADDPPLRELKLTLTFQLILRAITGLDEQTPSPFTPLDDEVAFDLAIRMAVGAVTIGP